VNSDQLRLQSLADANLDAVTAKDAEGVVSGFAEDGVLIDPHYPDSEMRGRAAIVAGLQFAFGGMRSFAFDDRRYFFDSGGTSLVIHCSCHHVLNGGRLLDFAQVFVIDTRAGRITRCQAFEPYGPDGLGGLVLGVGKFAYRTRRALQNRASRRGGE
jgi:hypothetical protein